MSERAKISVILCVLGDCVCLGECACKSLWFVGSGDWVCVLLSGCGCASASQPLFTLQHDQGPDRRRRRGGGAWDSTCAGASACLQGCSHVQGHTWLYACLCADGRAHVARCPGFHNHMCAGLCAPRTGRVALTLPVTHVCVVACVCDVGCVWVAVRVATSVPAFPCVFMVRGLGA